MPRFPGHLNSPSIVMRSTHLRATTFSVGVMGSSTLLFWKYAIIEDDVGPFVEMLDISSGAGTGRFAPDLGVDVQNAVEKSVRLR